MADTVNIIAFSIFGTQERYRLGLLKNLEAAPALFPGWTCLVYCDAFNHKLLGVTTQHMPHARIVLQADESHGLEGTTWRWLACRVPEVKAIIFRDSDSVLGAREKYLVDEWLNSPHEVHLIRDHPQHTSPVMAGMFGIKGAAIALLAEMVDKHQAGYRKHVYGDDQAFLNERFYPKIKAGALVHTSSVRYLFELAHSLPPCKPGELFIGAYEFATPAEQASYVAQKQSTPTRTLLPFAWKDRRVLKVFFKKIKLGRIRYGCRWCI